MLRAAGRWTGPPSARRPLRPPAVRPPTAAHRDGLPAARPTHSRVVKKVGEDARPPRKERVAHLRDMEGDDAISYPQGMRGVADWLAAPPVVLGDGDRPTRPAGQRRGG